MSSRSYWERFSPTDMGKWEAVVRGDSGSPLAFGGEITGHAYQKHSGLSEYKGITALSCKFC